MPRATAGREHLANEPLRGRPRRTPGSRRRSVGGTLRGTARRAREGSASREPLAKPRDLPRGVDDPAELADLAPQVGPAAIREPVIAALRFLAVGGFRVGRRDLLDQTAVLEPLNGLVQRSGTQTDRASG